MSRDTDNPISVVLLRKKPATQDPKLIEKATLRAWAALDQTERKVTVHTIDLPDYGEKVKGHWILAQPPLPGLRRHFVVVVTAATRYGDPEAGEFSDERLRALFEQHEAWLSIDLLANPEQLDEEQKQTFYRAACSLAAELVDQDTLLVLFPEYRRGYAVSERTVRALRASDPLRALASTVVPVAEISPDDPELKAAEERARERLPEFLQAFRTGVGSRHAVKVRLRQGDATEVIWVEVLSIEGKTIRGAIMNVPYRLDLKVGEEVEATLDDVSDWAYLGDDGRIVGAFTNEVIKKRSRGSRTEP